MVDNRSARILSALVVCFTLGLIGVAEHHQANLYRGQDLHFLGDLTKFAWLGHALLLFGTGVWFGQWRAREGRLWPILCILFAMNLLVSVLAIVVYRPPSIPADTALIPLGLATWLYGFDRGVLVSFQFNHGWLPSCVLQCGLILFAIERPLRHGNPWKWFLGIWVASLIARYAFFTVSASGSLAAYSSPFGRFDIFCLGYLLGQNRLPLSRGQARFLYLSSAIAVVGGQGWLQETSLNNPITGILGLGLLEFPVAAFYLFLLHTVSIQLNWSRLRETWVLFLPFLIYLIHFPMRIWSDSVTTGAVGSDPVIHLLVSLGINLLLATATATLLLFASAGSFSTPASPVD